MEALFITSLLTFILAVLQGLDIWTTNQIVFKQGGRELNPIMAWTMDHFGKLWWLPKLGLVAAGVVTFWVVMPPTVLLWFLILACATYIYVVDRNLKHVKIDDVP